jgi:hypothetical protein
LAGDRRLLGQIRLKSFLLSDPEQDTLGKAKAAHSRLPTTPLPFSAQSGREDAWLEQDDDPRCLSMELGVWVRLPFSKHALPEVAGRVFASSFQSLAPDSRQPRQHQDQWMSRTEMP